jgi:hypothetical protein
MMSMDPKRTPSKTRHGSLELAKKSEIECASNYSPAERLSSLTTCFLLQLTNNATKSSASRITCTGPIKFGGP